MIMKNALPIVCSRIHGCHLYGHFVIGGGENVRQLEEFRGLTRKNQESVLSITCILGNAFTTGGLPRSLPLNTTA